MVGYDRALLTQLLSAPQRVRLGAAVADAAAMAAKGRCRVTQGAYVGKVTAGGPAERAGLAAGDVIMSLGGQNVRDAARARDSCWRAASRVQTPVRYMRGDTQHDTTLPL